MLNRPAPARTPRLRFPHPDPDVIKLQAIYWVEVAHVEASWPDESQGLIAFATVTLSTGSTFSSVAFVRDGGGAIEARLTLYRRFADPVLAQAISAAFRQHAAVAPRLRAAADA
jgi:hypothetical protein